MKRERPGSFDLSPVTLAEFSNDKNQLTLLYGSGKGQILNVKKVGAKWIQHSQSVEITL